MKSLKDTDLALIEDYLNDQLTPTAAAQVRQRMDTDAAFKSEVEWMEQLVKLKDQKKSFEVLNTFQEIHRERQRKDRIIRRWAFAAAAAVLAILLFFLFKPKNTGNLPPIVAAPGIEETPTGDDNPSLTPETPAPPTAPGPDTAGGQKAAAPPIATTDRPPAKVQWDRYVVYKDGIQILGDDSVLGEARALMDGGKRTEALPILEKYFSTLTEEEEDFDLRLEAGKIYLKEEKNYARAAFHFKKVAEGDVIARYKMEAQFYLACAYLAQGKTSEAKKRLKTVADQDIEPWKSKAAELMKLL